MQEADAPGFKRIKWNHTPKHPIGAQSLGPSLLCCTLLSASGQTTHHRVNDLIQDWNARKAEMRRRKRRRSVVEVVG